MATSRVSVYALALVNVEASPVVIAVALVAIAVVLVAMSAVLVAMFAVLALILSELESIDTEIKGNPNKTPSLDRQTANGTVAAGAFSVSFANVGTADAGIGGDNTGPPVVAGTVLAPGETVTFSGSGKDTLAAIDYQASATAILLIAEVR